MPAGKKRKRSKWLILAAVLCILTVWTIWGNTALQLHTYTVTSARLPDALKGYRIAQVSDLHNTELGERNEKLLRLLQECEPDLIAITGDMIDSRRTDVEAALRFAEAAVQIAPCYYVSGNHEARTTAYIALRDGLRALGVQVLENERLTIEKGAASFSLVGLSDPAFKDCDVPEDRMFADWEQLEDESGAYTVLLSHRPELFSFYVDCGVDLVLTGHAHGGQIRLPLIGGLLAPNQGILPKYDAGAFTEGATTMIVSRGIGNSVFPVRFNNRPELLLIELQPAV